MQFSFAVTSGILSLFLLTTTAVNCLAEHEETHSEGEHESHGRHHAALFLGATTDFEEEETDFSLGADYEFRVLPQLGIGLLGEVTFAEEEVFIVGAPILFHPNARIVLGVAPGLEIVDEMSGEHEGIAPEGEEAETETETTFLLRLIGGYELELSSFTLTPTVSLDLVDGDASLVYGISFGKGF